ncbi:MAG TPA: response regulator [Nitrososphaera sp.]|nr:response regulator [Nitrososphaera sp.]
MRILIAEDEYAISMQYQIVLEERGHEVTITDNGEECLKVYMNSLLSTSDHSLATSAASIDSFDTRDIVSFIHETHPPFDIVVLDYKMPKKDGLETAQAILDLCPNQRIMFASAYTIQTLTEAVKSLHKIVELLQKPFDLEYFVDSVEDKVLYEQLERLNVRVRELRDFNVTNPQLIDLLTEVKKLQSMALRD